MVAGWTSRVGLSSSLLPQATFEIPLPKTVGHLLAFLTREMVHYVNHVKLFTTHLNIHPIHPRFNKNCKNDMHS